MDGRVKPGHDENEMSEIPGERSETRDRHERETWMAGSSPAMTRTR
jgi:hypothetical protein